MGPPKELARGKPFFCFVDPSELEGLDDWAEWLDSLCTGFCEVREIDGELHLVERRQLVANINRGIKVEIYPKEHPPPHFHVKSATLDASFTIDNCKLLHGQVPNSNLRVIRYWHRSARPELIRIWDTTRPGGCSVGAFVSPNTCSMLTQPDHKES